MAGILQPFGIPLVSGSGGAAAGLERLLTVREVPAAPEEFWAACGAKLRPEDMVELVIPIYRRHLSARDVRGLIAFYESPVGRKFVQVQPAIVKESMETGGEWGRKIAREAIEEARAHGYRTRPQ